MVFLYDLSSLAALYIDGEIARCAAYTLADLTIDQSVWYIKTSLRRTFPVDVVDVSQKWKG